MLTNEYYLQLNKRGELVQQSEIIMGIYYDLYENSLKASLSYGNRLRHTTLFEPDYLDKIIFSYIERLKDLHDNYAFEEFVIKLPGMFGNLKGKIIEKICCKTLYNFFKGEFLKEAHQLTVGSIDKLVINIRNNKYMLILQRENNYRLPLYVLPLKANHQRQDKYENKVAEFDYVVRLNGESTSELLLFEIKSGKFNKNGKNHDLIHCLFDITSTYGVRYIFFVPHNFAKNYPDFVKNYMKEVQKKIRQSKKGKRKNKLLISINPIYVSICNRTSHVDDFVWQLLQNKFKDDFKTLKYVREAEGCYKQICNSQKNR